MTAQSSVMVQAMQLKKWRDLAYFMGKDLAF